LYNVNINNIHSYHPGTQQALNPPAWAARQLDVRGRDHYSRHSVLGGFPRPSRAHRERQLRPQFPNQGTMNVFIQAKFVNIFNRTILPHPISSGTGVNPQNPVTKTAGINSSGFGVIHTFATPSRQPSTATPPNFTGRRAALIARFTF
jgi:hypothetical protein